MKESLSPNYHQIFSDIISQNYPDKEGICKELLQKKSLSSLEITKLNSLIFGESVKKHNQKHRSYSKKDILEILNYQKQHDISNSELARRFKLSRNSIAKWKEVLRL